MEVIQALPKICNRTHVWTHIHASTYSYVKETSLLYCTVRESLFVDRCGHPRLETSKGNLRSINCFPIGKRSPDCGILFIYLSPRFCDEVATWLPTYLNLNLLRLRQFLSMDQILLLNEIILAGITHSNVSPFTAPILNCANKPEQHSHL